MTLHISNVIADMFDRGSLPERVQVRAVFGPFIPGQVLTWIDADRCYMDDSRRWCAWAVNVRQGWGVSFGPSPAMHTQQSLRLVA